MEALGDIDRICKYDRFAHKAILELKTAGVLAQEPRPSMISDNGPGIQDYRLSLDYSALAQELIKLTGRLSCTEIQQWVVRQNKKTWHWEADPIKKNLDQFLKERFEEIGNGPEIEVVPHGDRSDGWRFNGARPLRSITELNDQTATALRDILELTNGGGSVQLSMICSTAEWLFLDKYEWAIPIGRRILELMEDGRAYVSLIVLGDPPLSSEQHRRGEEVIQKLSGADRDGKNHRIKRLNWWRLNRRLTFAQYSDSAGKNQAVRGIYFRRRLLP